jgi:hypothetical protein
VEKRNLNVTAAGRNNYSAGIVNVDFRYALHVLRKTSGA